jgi:hypothetical protein
VCIDALKRLVATGRGDSPLLMRQARRLLRVGGEDASVIRTLLDTHAWVTERLSGPPEAPKRRYDEAKPVALWSRAEIDAWQQDYPEYQWDVWCVVCGVHV